jgi:malonate-semialdehyde dehydrogenase (acetylating)/methylmalonate-semialdehyde dehydrogenase
VCALLIEYYSYLAMYLHCHHNSHSDSNTKMLRATRVFQAIRPAASVRFSSNTTKMFINGEFKESEATEWIPVHNPATNEVVTMVPQCTQAEMQAASDNAAEVFKTWSQTSVIARQGIMFKLQELLKKHQSEIAKNITLEQGKTLADAEGDVLRGIQVVEQACSMPSMLAGENVHTLAKDMDTIMHRIPLGVTAGICPFNFPAMIPLWMFPMALAAGNTMLLKPSERDPGAAMLIAKLV